MEKELSSNLLNEHEHDIIIVITFYPLGEVREAMLKLHPFQEKLRCSCTCYTHMKLKS